MSDQQTSTQPRIFKIGATRIVEDASMAALSPEQVRERLKMDYPEIAHATIRQTILEDGTQVIEWLPIAGRKG